MKKVILAVVLLAAIATIFMAVSVDVGGEIAEPAPDMVIQAMPQGTPAYVRHDAVVAEVTDSAVLLDAGEEQPETATISEDTVILTAAGETTDISALEAGANVSVFVDGNAAVPLIYPAQYPASYIVIGDEIGFAGVDIDVYTESDSLGMYINGAGTLAINVDEDSVITTASGSRIRIDPADLADRELAVFYNMMTMSIPAMTSPLAVIVLGE